MLNVILLSVTYKPFMLRVVMLSVIILSVIMLSVIMPSVVAPFHVPTLLCRQLSKSFSNFS